jgi:hypothetical protein
MPVMSEVVDAMTCIVSLNRGGSSFLPDPSAAGRGDSEALGSGVAKSERLTSTSPADTGTCVWNPMARFVILVSSRMKYSDGFLRARNLST